MRVRSAFVRAVRTAIQVFAAAIPAAPVAVANDVVKNYATAYAYAAVLGGFALCTSFAQNFAEDNSGVNPPKG